MRPFQTQLEQITKVLQNWDQAPAQVRAEGSRLVGTISRGSLEAQIKDPLTQEWVKTYLVDKPPMTLTDIFATSPYLYAWLMSKWRLEWLQENNFRIPDKLDNEDLLTCIIHLFQLEITSPSNRRNYHERRNLLDYLGESAINPFNMAFPRMFLKSRELIGEYNITYPPVHDQQTEVNFNEAEPLLNQPAFANLFGRDQIHLNPSWLAPTRQALWDQSLTGHSCRLCIEDGIVVCPQCYEGTVECEECNGEGQTNCDNCDDGWGESPGTVNCYECDGDGEVTCYECDREGKVECEECEGSQKVTCEECSGDGEQDGGEPCSECDGEGETNCEECDEGMQTCSQCDGSGSERCDDCDGEGVLECEECWGGGTQECEECDEGRQTCWECEEDYFIGTCPANQLHDLTGKSLGLVAMENMPESMVNDYLLKGGREVAGTLTFEYQPLSVINNKKALNPILGETVFIFIPNNGYMACCLRNKRNQEQISFGNPRPRSTYQNQAFLYQNTPLPYYFWNTNIEDLQDMSDEVPFDKSQWEFSNYNDRTNLTHQWENLFQKGIMNLLVVKGVSLPTKTFNWPQSLP